MKKLLATMAICWAALAAPSSQAAIITSVPGPDDQGGMIMPMVNLTGNSLGVMFMPPSTPPLLASLTHWSPGNTFAPSAAWYPVLDPVGGEGALFNNQYGFTFMSMDPLPEGKALGLRLTSASEGLQFWNYVNNQNRFDEVFQDINSQVLWNGSMWHNYVTLAADAAPGIYTASFEVFIANGTFTEGTGYADYSDAALSATQDTSYSTVTINYTWQVVPEPSTYLLLGLGVGALWFVRRKVRLA